MRDIVQKAERISDEDQRETLLRQAYDAAQASVKGSPNSSNEHLWLAIAAGRLGIASSNKERVQLSKVVKDHAERAIALDPRNGTAYMVLGAWHFYVSDLSWLERNAAKVLYGQLPPASYRDAVTNLTKALQLGVDDKIEAYYLRGRAYDGLDNESAAAADYKACLAMTARNPRETRAQRDARRRVD